MRVRILRPPRLRTEESEEHRSATWLELFYDLVFVVAVANLAQRLLADPSVAGFFSYVGIFIPMWWAWAGYTFYADRFDTDDLGQRLLAICQMITIAIMAASISGDVADSSAVFALSYVLARVILLIMYWRARRHIPAVAPLVTGYLKGFSLGGSFWLVSVFVPTPWRFVLWAIGLSVSFYTPYRYRKLQAKVPLDVSHLPERFGLFTILVFGESIAAVIAGLSHEEWQFRPVVGAILGVLIASGMWWLYFDNHEGSVVRRLAAQKTAWKPTAWIYSHLPLAIFLTAAGIGLEFVVADAAHDFPASARWIVAIGVAGAMLSLALNSIATDSANKAGRYKLKSKVRLAGAAVAIVIGAIPASALVTASLLFLLIVAQVVTDVAVDSQPFEEPLLQ